MSQCMQLNKVILIFHVNLIANTSSLITTTKQQQQHQQQHKHIVAVCVVDT